MLNRIIFLLSFFITIWYNSYAQESGIVHSITKSKGLSNGAVNAISGDSEGYMWFGTWNGLNRYDGNKITNFLPGKGPYSIHNHVVREIYPAQNGSIWMLTNKGISHYDNVKSRFYSFFTEENEQINYENDISLAHSDKVGTFTSISGNGIFKFNPNSSTFEKLRFVSTSTRTSLTVKRIHIIGDSTYCITSNNQLCKITGNQITEIMKLPIGATITSSLGTIMNGEPYLYITQRASVSLLINIHQRKVHQFSIPNDVVTCFGKSLDANSIWFGTEKGKIYKLQTKTRSYSEHKMPVGIPNTIVTRVLSIYESSPDLLWIGTDGNGIYLVKLSTFPNKTLSSKMLSYPIVRSILVTSTKHMLIGTKGGGMDIFNPEGEFLRNISVNNGLSNNSVLSFHEMPDGRIMVGTDGYGIDIVSADFRKVMNFPRDFLTPEFQIPAFASVYKILETKDNRIYLGTSGFGVIMLEFDKKKNSEPIYYEQVKIDNGANSQKQIVYALAEEKPGIIWIGTRGFGIYRYNSITKRVMAQFNSNTHPDAIFSDDILSLLTDKTGRIIAGTSCGIFSFTIAGNENISVSPLDLQEELSNTSFHAIQEDKTGNLWASSNKGLSFINTRNKTMISFTSGDGLINEEYSDGASFYNNMDGVLYVGGTNGVDMVTTSDIQIASYFPPVAINELLIRNLPVEISDDGVLKRRINLVDELVLNNNQNALTFNVSPLVFHGRERHKISYRLLGLDDNWVLNAPNQSINFTNLNPGSYTLQLRVSDENGNWSKNIKEIKLVINPPWWKSFWAITLFIIVLLGIQYLFIRQYLRRQSRKKEAELQELTLQKEKELQSYKIEFFTNIAHEFRTPLTLISSHIHMLMEESVQFAKNPGLIKVYNNTLKLQKLVLEIMQFRKLEKGKEPVNVSMVSPVMLAQEVITDLEPLAEQNNIKCEVVGSDSETTIYTDGDKYQRILTNLISNAIKYNRVGGFVSVKITFEDKYFITEIKDSGKGISQEFKNKVFEPFGVSSAEKRNTLPNYNSSGLGLAVTKGLVDLLKGSIAFDSEIEQGTTFTITLPSLPSELASVTDNNTFNNTTDEAGKLDLQAELVLKSPEFPKNTDIIANGGKANILVVDDDPGIIEMLTVMLSPKYAIFTANNGEQAMEIIKKNNISLVVSDIMMPVMDGIELCKAIRDNFDTSHLPLILLTAKSEIEDRIKGLQAGADSYIPKPFHPEHLIVRIEKLLEKRQTLKDKFGNKNDTNTLINEIQDPFFRKLLNYIDENIDDDTLLSDKLCESLGISKSSLYNKTKQVLGTTPHGLINQRRLRKASVLLDTTSLNVSEIIDQTGFNSRAHFYELFNKVYGCSPTEYRQKSKIY
jgi:signal transduction histidine kinase/CheY-like chemotaxis protein